MSKLAIGQFSGVAMTSVFFPRTSIPFFLFMLAGILAAFPAIARDNAGSSQQNALTAFKSEAELDAWLQSKVALVKAHGQRSSVRYQSDILVQESSVAHKVPAPSSSLARSAVSEAPAAESVTSVQTAGVDEGGIVKVHDSHLVILRRGRLFTIDISGNRLSLTSMIDAFAPGSTGHAWYDEMLVSGSTIVVIGYSYSKGGTEVVLFDIDRRGRLAYRATYILRSNDYYSSRNYASRLIGNRLIFYTPLYLNFYGSPIDCFPAVSTWEDGKRSDFERIAPATRIFRTADDLDPIRTQIALHTVQTCDISQTGMDCTAAGILAPAGREFYVSKDAVYIWTAPFTRFRPGRTGSDDGPVRAALFRLPLDEKQTPTAIRTLGSPIDQFSFLESPDGHLNVLLRSEGPAASMWAAEIGSHDLALLRVPLSELGDGSQSVPAGNYYPLPSPSGGRSIQNRFVGDFLLYGAGSTWRRQRSAVPGSAYALSWKNLQAAPVELSPSHSVDRIEALGSHALLAGTQDRDLVFTTVALTGTGENPHANTISSFRLADATQGETRSHGFFYKADSERSGVLGLPFRGSEAAGWQQLKKPSSGIIYLKNNNLSLSDMGVLSALSKSGQKDDCKASCVDWYGNSRPLFLKGRVFALMGYELVEGRIHNNRITEVRRTDFIPRPKGQPVPR